MTTDRAERADLFATIRAAAAADAPCTLTCPQVNTLQKTLVSVLDLLNEYRDRAQDIPPASSGAGGELCRDCTNLVGEPTPCIVPYDSPATPEPRGCPTPGACSCTGADVERQAFWTADEVIEAARHAWAAELSDEQEPTTFQEGYEAGMLAAAEVVRTQAKTMLKYRADQARALAADAQQGE